MPQKTRLSAQQICRARNVDFSLAEAVVPRARAMLYGALLAFAAAVCRATTHGRLLSGGLASRRFAKIIADVIGHHTCLPGTAVQSVEE